ncbi:L-lactate permease [Paludisphaera soli]|uniref:L-lactate permease n=1 Tax=Paludisphaera soli TaxID=2712865 RepID=UPI0013EDBC43|nr:L-lactate permease [Paludisphaera soli]
MWTQDYDPFGSWPLSTLLAALPILTLMGLLASNRVPAWLAASAALATAFGAAVLGFHMPWAMAASAAGVGAVFALIRVVYLVVAAMFLYDLAVKTGRFEVMKASIARLSPDRRIQAVLVAFSFGSFLEGCAGFGAPVAIASAFLVGLGFRPLQAAVLALAADTVPVSWGSVGIPLTTLGAVSGLDVPALSVTTARLLTIATLGLPFWLAAIVAGPRRAFGAWPPLLAVGATYAAVQLLWSRFVAVELVSIASAIASLVAGVVVLRFWRPSETFRFEGEDEPEPEAAADPDFGTPAAKLSRREVARAWMPFALLTVVVMAWVTPAFPSLGTRSAKDVLDAAWSWKPEVGGLHKKVVRGAAVTGRETPTEADLEAAVLDVTPLSAVGTAVLVAAVVGGLLTGVGPREQGRIFLGTARRMKTAALAIVCMLALGFVTRYSGMDAVLGLAFTRTGPALYPIFGTLLGWLGTALTGSITSSNVLFGNLQRITATNLDLSPILMGAANTAGGAMGKMIAAASIVVAAAATGEGGREGEVLRAALRHSLAMVAGVAAVVWVAARFAPWIAAVPAG